MRISPVGSIQPLTNIASVGKTGSSAGVSETGDAAAQFGEVIKKAVKQVNTMQTEADTMANQLATGDVEDVHKAMLSMQKAKLALDFTVQVRNKAVEAYQEIMRMQM